MRAGCTVRVCLTDSAKTNMAKLIQLLLSNHSLIFQFSAFGNRDNTESFTAGVAALNQLANFFNIDCNFRN